jgi:predicted nucleotidyltransferase
VAVADATVHHVPDTVPVPGTVPYQSSRRESRRLRGSGSDNETTIPGLDIEGIVRIFERGPARPGFHYGSHVRGEAGSRRDIDQAVAFNESLSSFERTRARLELIEQLSTELGTNDVDAVRLSDAPSELLEEILADGALIYGSMTDLEPYQGQAPPSSTHQDRLAAFDDVLDELNRHL